MLASSVTARVARTGERFPLVTTVMSSWRSHLAEETVT